MSNPDLRPRPSFRLSSTLAVGAAVTNGVAVTEVVPIAGSARLRVRIKTSGNGALDVVLVGPDYDPKIESGTSYTTGNPTQVAVTGGTEAKIDVDLYGENHAIVKFTPSANGTITFCDVSQV